MSFAKECAACRRTFITKTMAADLCNDCTYSGRTPEPPRSIVDDAIDARLKRGEVVDQVSDGGDMVVRWDEKAKVVVLDTGNSVIEFTVAQAEMLRDSISMAIKRVNA